ncbi:hypothetical protein Nepgr_020343 [Nepenthes gracilis]|uniref:Uncharacterized protein n=1 Tax=Nepenthes gracilis TaxID=150966 RepID=A0AAD3SWW0_NEPGR|nr:hypothetical protein Nepgr_020343 [Nepenthes gracilis]
MKAIKPGHQTWKSINQQQPTAEHSLGKEHRQQHSESAVLQLWEAKHQHVACWVEMQQLKVGPWLHWQLLAWLVVEWVLSSSIVLCGAESVAGAEHTTMSWLPTVWLNKSLVGAGVRPVWLDCGSCAVMKPEDADPIAYPGCGWGRVMFGSVNLIWLESSCCAGALCGM